MAYKKKNFFHYLPIYGCISTGIIYLSIGVIAILSFLKLKKGGADESSLLAFLNDFLVGKIFIWVILLGTVCYIIWRIYESIKDPYNYGNSGFGLAKRLGIAASSIADALIAITAIQILFGNSKIQEDGDPDELRQMVGNLLQESWGNAFIISIGIITCITAIIQLWYGITKGYKERIDIADFKPYIKSGVHFLAWSGYLARGIILGIIGFFYIKAGILEAEKYIVNTDKAFDFIGDHVGHIYFILVAIGTIFYGIFMFTHGITYDSDKD